MHVKGFFYSHLSDLGFRFCKLAYIGIMECSNKIEEKNRHMLSDGVRGNVFIHSLNLSEGIGAANPIDLAPVLVVLCGLYSTIKPLQRTPPVGLIYGILSAYNS